MNPTSSLRYPRIVPVAALLAALWAAGPPSPAAADSLLIVNSTADTVAVDSVLTLREALLHGLRSGDLANGTVGISCLTTAEWDQMWGDIENCVELAAPNLAGCVHNPATDGPRWAFKNDCFGNQSGPGMGRDFADTIQFHPSIASVTTSGNLWVFRRDRLDGARSGGGRVALVASSAPANAAGLVMMRAGTVQAYEPFQIVVENLEVSGFPGDCILAQAPAESTFRNLLLRGCGRHGLALVPETAHGRNPFQNQIGGGAGLGNEIRDNAQWGIYAEVNPAFGTGSSLNRFEGNRVGWAATDAGGAHGNDSGGLALVNARGNIVGSSDPARGNRLSGNGGAGLLLVGSEARENEVFGNFVGLADSAGLWLAQPNGEGIVLDAGANGNKIGGAGGGEGNFVALNIDAGMRLSNNSDFNFVRRNWIGLAPNATQAGNGGDGVRIEGASNQNLVSGNVISANGGAGVRIDGVGTDSNTLDANLIGVDPTGALDRGNMSHGVLVTGGAKSNRIGSAAGLGNQIAGNSQDGIHVSGAGTDSTAIYANLVGLNAARTQAVPNNWSGVALFWGPKLTNLGGAASLGNTISGNGQVGIYVAGTGTNQNLVRGNLIGLATGASAIGNGQSGILVWNDADLNTLHDNVIAGNGGPGIELLGPGLAGGPVTQNLIGRDAADQVDRPNSGPGIRLAGGVLGAEITENVVRANLGHGIVLADAATSGTLLYRNQVTGNTLDGLRMDGGSGNVVGGIGSAWLNEFRANGGFGVRVASGTGNVIRGNILTEQLQAIVLGAGHPPNDPYDLDGGPNQQLNRPIAFASGYDPTTWELSWGLMSAANTQFTVDSYAGYCSAAGELQPELHLGSASILTDNRGLYRGTLYFFGAMPALPYVALAVTDPSGNTSELSLCLPLGTLDSIHSDSFETGWLDGWTDWSGAAP